MSFTGLFSTSCLCASLLFLSFTANAEDHGKHHKMDAGNMHKPNHHKNSNAVLLPKTLESLLLKEMNSLEKGLSQLMPEVVSGNWKNIQDIGQKMHDSYILKQSLSKNQIQQLHQSLPEGFKRLDHQLHHSAGMMAHAAEKKNMELVNFYLYKVTETCVNCHSQYATDRFPQLVSKKQHH